MIELNQNYWILIFSLSQILFSKNNYKKQAEFFYQKYSLALKYFAIFNFKKSVDVDLKIFELSTGLGYSDYLTGFELILWYSEKHVV